MKTNELHFEKVKNMMIEKEKKIGCFISENDIKKAR